MTVDGSVVLALNPTFVVEEIEARARVSQVPIPRADREFVSVPTFRAAVPLRLRGWVAPAGGGAVPLDGSRNVMSITDEAAYVAALHELFDKASGSAGRLVLDLCNGTIMYVIAQGVRSRVVEGFPELREISIDLLADDPFGYTLDTTDAVPRAGTKFLDWAPGGNRETRCWVLTISTPPGAGKLTVNIGLIPLGLETMTLTARDTDTLVVNGYKRHVHLASDRLVAVWDRFQGDFLRFRWPPDPTYGWTLAFKRSSDDALLTPGTDIIVTLRGKGAYSMPTSYQDPAAMTGKYESSVTDHDVIED